MRPTGDGTAAAAPPRTQRARNPLAFLLVAALCSAKAPLFGAALTEFRVDYFWSTTYSADRYDNLAAGDPDGDSRLELLSVAADENGPYWYQFALDAFVQREFASLPGQDGLRRIVPLPQPGGDRVLLVWEDHVEIHDGRTDQLLKSIATQVDPLLSAAVVDVDADGDLEVVLCGRDDLEVRNYSNGSLVKSAANRGGYAISIGQIDADPQVEIAVLEGPSGSAVLDGVSLAPDWVLPAGIEKEVRLGDLDSDGKDEVLWSTDRVFAWNPRTNTSVFTSAGPGPPALLLEVFDVDSNGSKEVVVASDSDAVVVLDGATGAVVWSVPLPDVFLCCTGLAIGNFDADAAIEIAISTSGGSGTPGHLIAVDAETRQIQNSDGQFGPHFQALAAGDLAGDGGTDLVVGARESGFFGLGKFLIFDEGTRRTTYESGSWSGYLDGILESATVSQLDDDPQLELCLAGGAPLPDRAYVRCLDGAKLEEEWSYGVEGQVRFFNLAAADLDMDGAEEILALLEGDIHAVDALRGESGEFFWQSPFLSTLAFTPAGMFVGDVVGTSAPEVVVHYPFAHTVILNGQTGAVLNSFASTASVVAVAQLDADAPLEIVVDSSCTSLKILNPVSGTLGSALFPLAECPWEIASGLATRDAVTDLVVTNFDTLDVLDGATHTRVWHSPPLVRAMARRRPILIRDLDGNTVPEIVVGGERGFLVIEAPLVAIFSSGFQNGTTGWTVVD